MESKKTREVAVVRQVLPNGMCRAELPGGRLVRACLAHDARALVGRLVAGDRVELEVTPGDPGEGRILGRPRGERGR